MKTSQLTKFVRALTLAAMFTYTFAASATTYYWKPGATWGSFGDVTNWSTVSIDGDAASACPSENDNLFSDAHYFFDLDGQVYTIKGKSVPGDWSTWNEGYRNGTLNITSTFGSHYGETTISNATLNLVAGSNFNPNQNGGGKRTVHICKDGTFNLLGKFSCYAGVFDVQEGGTLHLEPTQVNGASSSQNSNALDNNGGLVELPLGLKWDVGGWSNSYKYTINQKSGTMILGGNLSISTDGKMVYNVNFNGGTVEITDDVEVQASAVTLGSVTLDIDEGKTLFLNEFSVADNALPVKSGLGLLSLGHAPTALKLNGGTVRVPSCDIPSLTFDGGTLILEADSENGLPLIVNVSVTQGEKAKLALRNLAHLADGSYTIVAAGNSLATDDYEFAVDPVVNSSVAVKADGSVVLTIDGIADDPNPFVWDPQDENAVWSADCAVWLNDEEHKVFDNGHAAKFTGAENSYISRIAVQGLPMPSKLIVESDRDYTFAGDQIDTRLVEKRGKGVLMFDGKGTSGRTVLLEDGTLAFGGAGQTFAAAGTSVNVPDEADVRIGGFESNIPDDEKYLFTFRYKAGSENWTKAVEGYTVNQVNTMANIMKVSPVAPDGTSLSGKSVWISGNFYVSNDEAGYWTFSGIYDDSILLKIDGEERFQTASWEETKSTTISLSAGWHSFEIRAYDGSGGFGHDNCITAKKPGADYAQAFTETNFDMNWRGRELDPYVCPSVIRLDLTAGTKAIVTFTSGGIVLGDKTVIDPAATVAIDYHTVPANKTFLSCANPAVLADMKTRIQASLGSVGEIVETEDGLAWKMKAVFSGTVRDLNDPDGWMIGVVPGADENVTIAGAETVAEFTAGTPGFASMTMTDGATLSLVSERPVNALTLSAGTGLGVCAEGVKELKSEAFVPPSEAVVIAETDGKTALIDYEYSCTMAGQSWNVLSQPSQAAIKKDNGDGSVTVQFQRADDVWTKVAYVKFTQDVNGVISAKGVKAVYVSGNQVGKDMDSLSVNSSTYAPTDGEKAYAAKNIVLSCLSFDVGGTVVAAGPFETTGNGVVTVDVAANNVLDLSDVEVTTEAKLVKTGAGTIVFGRSVPTAADIQEGAIALFPDVEYDLSGIAIAPDVAYMTKTSAGLQKGYPVATLEGKTVLKAEGTYMGVGSWNDEQNWAGGVIPGAGAPAFISGEGTKVTIGDSGTTMPAEITVEDGATLEVLSDVSLPKLTLAPTAAVILGDNARSCLVSLSSAPIASIDASGDEVVLPVFNVATNVTLTVPGNTYFKNLDMTICGKITTPTANCGMVRFGYAAAGETSYIKLLFDQAEIRPLVNQSNDGGAIGVVYPDVGGTVVPLADIVMRTVNFNPCGGWTEWRNTYVGANNPQDVDFNVIWDNTRYECTWGNTIGGAAHMYFRNNAHVRYNAACINHGAGNFFITDSATVVFEDATTYLEYCQSNKSVDFSPDNANFKQVFFRNGARFIQNGVTGNKNAIVTFENGEVVIPNNYRQYDVLNNVGSVAIEADSWLTISGANQGQGSDWDRVIKFTNAPITGEGSLMVTNMATGKLMDVTIVNGANTATGLALAAAEEGTMLRFADGANWAGTVVANGHVATTNLTDGAAATSVTFGNLKLASGEFPIRVFKDAKGVLTCDQVNLTGNVLREAGDTGIIRLTGVEPEIGDKINLGTALAGAWAKAVVKTASGHTVQVIESEPDEHGFVTATLAVPTGFSIIIR